MSKFRSLAEGEREGNGVLGIVLYGEEASFVEAGDKSVHTRSFWNSEEFSGGDVGEERVGAWSVHSKNQDEEKGLG